MPLVTVDSVILQSFAYGETSKILRLLTATHGVRSVIARGALRPKSRFGGLLEPFSEGVATMYVRDNRDLQTLSAFELTTSNQGLALDLVRFGGGSLLAEIVLRTASEEPYPGLFNVLRTGLWRVRTAAVADIESVLLSATWRLVDTLGFAPELDACVACGRSIEPAEAVTFDYAAGGIRCDECAPLGTGRPLPAHARSDLQRFGRGEAVNVQRTEAHWRLLGRYLAHHVLEGTPLRSLEFLAASIAAAPCDV
jgi:DNA repair protein RecO (recombination protein O)